MASKMLVMRWCHIPCDIDRLFEYVITKGVMKGSLLHQIDSRN